MPTRQSPPSSTAHAAAPALPLNDTELETLQSLLDQVPAPLEALDAVSLDGFLCGVLLQPRPLPPARWLPFVADIEGRALPAGYPAAALQALVLRRHAEVDRAIQARDWFDPWIYEIDESAPPAESMLPWVAGFATAMELFPGLMDIDDPELVEPLALLYRHFETDDLEDADALLAVIETLEPPADLAEAVQDTVRSLMLMADVTRPRAAPTRPTRPTRPAIQRTGPARGGQRKPRR